MSQDQQQHIEMLRVRQERLEGFLKHDQSNYQLAMDCYEIAFQLGDFTHAQSLLDSISESHPEEPRILFNQAQVALAIGDYQVAFNYLTAIKNQGLDSTALRYNLALTLLNLDKINDAEQTLLTADGIFEDYPPSQLLLARIFHAKQHVEQAFSQVENFLSIDANSSDGNGLAAILCLDLGRNEDAQQYANTSLSIDDSNHESLIVLSGLALQQQNSESALKYLSKNPHLTQKSGRLILNLGQAQMLEQKYELAEKSLSQAVNLMEQHIGSWHALAWCKLILNKVKEAKSCFEKALLLERNFAETHGGLSFVAILENDYELADTLCEKALRLDPMSFSGIFTKSILLEHHGDPIAAKDKIQLAFKPRDDKQSSPSELVNKMLARLNKSTVSPNSK